MTNPYARFIPQAQPQEQENPYTRFVQPTEDRFSTARGRAHAEHQSRAELAEAIKRSLADPNITPERRQSLERVLQRQGPAGWVGNDAKSIAKGIIGSAAGSWASTGLAANDLLLAAAEFLPGVGDIATRGRSRIAEAQAALAELTGTTNSGMVESLLGGLAGGVGTATAGAKIGGKIGAGLTAPYQAFAAPAQAILKRVPGGGKALTGNLAQRVTGQVLADAPINLAQALTLPDGTSQEMAKSLGIQTIATAIGATLPGYTPRPQAPKAEFKPGGPTRAPDDVVKKAADNFVAGQEQANARKAQRAAINEASREARSAWIQANPGLEWKAQSKEKQKAIVGAWILANRPEVLEGKLPPRGVEPEQMQENTVPENLEAAVLDLQNENRRLREDLYTDPLTGVGSKSAFKAMLDRGATDGDFVMLDLANLGKRNNSGAHADGDTQLAMTAEMLRNAAVELGIPMRNIFRTGGDEFVAVVPTGKGNDFGKRVAELFGRDPIPGGDENYIRYGVGRDHIESDMALIAEKARDKGISLAQLAQERVAQRTEEGLTKIREMHQPKDTPPDISPATRGNPEGYQRLMDDLTGPRIDDIDTDDVRVLLAREEDAVAWQEPAQGNRGTPDAQRSDLDFVELPKLTKAEQDALEWAIDPMGEYFRNNQGETRPDLEGVEVVDAKRILNDPDVLEDLRYRLLEQLPHMAEAEIPTPQVRTQIAAASRAYAKIKSMLDARGPKNAPSPGKPAVSEPNITPMSGPEARIDPRQAPSGEGLGTRAQLEDRLEDVWQQIDKYEPGTAPQALIDEVTHIGKLLQGKETLDRMAVNGYPENPVVRPDPAAPERRVVEAPKTDKPMSGPEFAKLFKTPVDKLSNADAKKLFTELEIRTAQLSKKNPDAAPYFNKMEELQSRLIDDIQGKELAIRGEVTGSLGGFLYGLATADEDENPLLRAGFYAGVGLIAGRKLQSIKKQPRSPVIHPELLSKVKTKEQAKDAQTVDNGFTRARLWYAKTTRGAEGVAGITRPLKLDAVRDPGYWLEKFGDWIGQAESWIAGKPYISNPDGTARELDIRSASDILELVKGDVDGLGKVAAAHSALERYKITGRAVSGIDPLEAIEVIRQAPPEYHEAAAAMRQYHAGLLEVAVEAGLITRADMERMSAEEFYTALERHFGTAEKPIDMTNKKKASISAEKPIYGRKGSSGADIKNPVETMIANTARLLRAAEISRARNGLIDVKEAFPEYMDKFIQRVDRNTKGPDGVPLVDPDAELRVESLRADLDVSKETAERLVAAFGPQRLDPTMSSMMVYRDGHLRTYRVHGLIAETFKALRPVEQHMIFNWLGMANNFARAGIVNNPVFVGYQFLRDTWQATNNSMYGFVPGLDSVKGLIEIMRQGEIWKEYSRAGGGHQALQHRDIFSLERSVAHARKPGESAGGTALARLKELHPYQAWQALTIPFAEAARMGEYMRARDAGVAPIEAAYASKHVVGNFQQYGLSTRALSMSALFLNPALQAFDQTIYSAGLHPFRGAPKQTGASTIRNVTQGVAKHLPFAGKELGQATVADRAAAAMSYGIKNLLGIGIPSALLWMANRDDQEIKDLRTSEAGSRFWFTRVGGELVKIPKPIFEGQVFGTAMEVALDRMLEKDPMAVERWVHAVENDASINLLPTLGVVGASLWSNKDYRFGGPIVPAGQENVDPSLQMGASTTLPARVVGKWLDPVSKWVNDHRDVIPAGELLARTMTPAGLDYVVRNLGGTLRAEAMYGLGKAIEAQGKDYAPPKDEWPIIRQVLVRYPVANVGPMQDFYQQAERLDRRQRTAAWLAKHDPVGLVNYLQKYGMDLAKADLYAKTRQSIADLRVQYQNMQLAPAGTFQPSDVREVQEQMIRTMIELARMTNSVAAQMQ